MDIVFGSSGIAAADQERMDQVNREVGLSSKIRGDQVTPPSEKAVTESVNPEKTEV